MEKKIKVGVQHEPRLFVTRARATARGTIRIEFGDGFAKSMSLKKLGLSPEGVSLATLTAAPDGSGIRFAATFGPAVVLDGPTLRYLANAEFAAEVDAFAGHATIPNEKLERLAAKHTVSRGLSHNLNPQ